MLDRAHNNVGPMHMCFNTAKSVSIKKILNWLLRELVSFFLQYIKSSAAVCARRG